MGVVIPFFRIVYYNCSSVSRQKKITEKRFKKLVKYARKHSDAAAELYKDLGDDFCITDVPPMTKQFVNENFDRWVTDKRLTHSDLVDFVTDPDNIGKRYKKDFLIAKTSGSTGVPLIVVHDDTFCTLVAIESIFMKILKDMPLAAVIPTRLFTIPSCTMKNNLDRFPFMRKKMFLINAFSDTKGIVDSLNKVQPATLMGQPSNLDVLADEVYAGRLKIHPKTVICNSEILDDLTRANLRKAYGVEPRSIYGCTEGGNIAFECEYGHHHLHSQFAIVEPVDKDGNPVPYGVKSDKVYVTNLAEKSMPMIRYEVSDCVTLHPARDENGNYCPCGRKTPWIDIEGRVNDHIALFKKDGEIVRLPMLEVHYTCTCVVDGLKRLQFILHGYDNIEVRAVFHEGTDVERGRQQVLDQVYAFIDNHGLTDMTVSMSDTPPMADPKTAKFKRMYQLFD